MGCARSPSGSIGAGSCGWYEGSITLSQAQLPILIEGIDWREPERISSHEILFAPHMQRLAGS